MLLKFYSLSDQNLTTTIMSSCKKKHVPFSIDLQRHCQNLSESFLNNKSCRPHVGKLQTVSVSMTTDVHVSVKTAVSAVVIVPQEAVRTDARSNLEIKESYDETA